MIVYTCRRVINVDTSTPICNIYSTFSIILFIYFSQLCKKDGSTVIQWSSYDCYCIHLNQAEEYICYSHTHIYYTSRRITECNSGTASQPISVQGPETIVPYIFTQKIYSTQTRYTTNVLVYCCQKCNLSSWNRKIPCYFT